MTGSYDFELKILKLKYSSGRSIKDILKELKDVEKEVRDWRNTSPESMANDSSSGSGSGGGGYDYDPMA